MIPETLYRLENEQLLCLVSKHLDRIHELEKQNKKMLNYLLKDYLNYKENQFEEYNNIKNLLEEITGKKAEA